MIRRGEIDVCTLIVHLKCFIAQMNSCGTCRLTVLAVCEDSNVLDCVQGQ